MKKLILAVIIWFAFCGSLFAQSQYESHWPGFVNLWEDQEGITAAIAIDGHIFTVDDEGWDALEVAFFVGDECRGTDNYLNRENVDFYGDPYPITYGSPIYFTNAGDLVTFKLYDHVNLVEYDICEVTYLGEPLEVVTGIPYLYAWNNDPPNDPVILNFSSSFTKDIAAYTEGQKDHYYLLASPIGMVSPEDVTNMLSNTYDLYYFDQAAQDGKEWITYKSGEGATNPGFDLEPGKGYLYANSADVTLTFSGAPFNNANYEVNLTKAQGVDLPGWNLVGNPFGQTAYIQNSKPFYVMNTEGTEIESATSNAINVMEGVFVEAESDGEEMTFTTTQPNKNNEQIVLNVTHNNRGAVIDRAIVRFNQENGLPKFQLNPNNTKVYIPQNDKDYAVVHAESQGELPVNFKASKNGTYTFSVTAEEVDVNYLHLIDNLTGADVDLKATPSYSFEARTTDYASRFKLVFTVERATDEVFAFFSNGNWVINNDGKAVLQVIDITGRILSNEQISGNASKHIDAAPGVYVMRLINGDNVKTQKIVVSK